MYKGQTESPYKWSSANYNEAVYMLADLKIEEPDRIWWIEEKDVS
jgi:hypothetical protein